MIGEEFEEETSVEGAQEADQERKVHHSWEKNFFMYWARHEPMNVT